MRNRIALILGSGAGVGTHVAGRLRSEGYRVATVSRSAKDAEYNSEAAIALGADLANPTEVEKAFETVRGAWGEPSVVVYNGTEPEITTMSDTTPDNVPC
jgi:NAD(P)-dependent dehydrogenase (short-subunit alcohol dehydrogenase family)